MTITEKIKLAQEKGKYLDFYCERIAGEESLLSVINFSDEPLNTISNFAFIIAGFFLIKLIRSEQIFKAKNFDIIILSLNLFLIGVGSAIYHYHPNKTTLLVDVLPISFFMHFYLVSLSVRVVGLKIWQSLIILGIFIYANYWAGANFDAQILNGTILYLPSFTTLMLMVFASFIKNHPAKNYLLNTAILWLISLSFRTIDISTCELTMGIGTHIIWHIINAAVLYRLVKALTIKKPL
ncbi:MAG: ceramidase domain-containing protein [Rickettsiales bacterium]|nr:ceramidase domain-containing protein [Rickettsiales bacterium]